MDQQKHDEFAECLFRNQHRVFGYILALVPNRDDADEVFQQTCLTLWKNWEWFDRSREFFPWACGFAHNQIRHYYRSNVRSRVQLDTDVVESLAEPASDFQQGGHYFEALRECLGRLPERSHRAIEAFYGGQPVSSVAQKLNSTSNAIYKLLRRVRVLLRDCVLERLAAEAST